MINVFDFDFSRIRKAAERDGLLQMSYEYPSIATAIDNLNELTEQANKKLVRLEKSGQAEIQKTARNYRKALDELPKNITTQDVFFQEDRVYISLSGLDAFFAILAEIDKLNEAYEKTKSYEKALTGRAINKMHQVSQHDMNVHEVITPNGLIIEGEITKEEFEIIIGNFDLVNWNAQACKLLDILLIELCKQAPHGGAEEVTREKVAGFSRVTITLDEYMNYFGLKDKRNAREQFRDAAAALMNVRMKFDYDAKIKGKNGRARKQRKNFDYHLFEGHCEEWETEYEARNPEKIKIVNSEFHFDFSIGLLQYLCNRQILPLATGLFRINPRTNPHAFYIGYKLMEHYNSNAPKVKAVRLSVKSLLENCPEIPDIKEVPNRRQMELIHNAIDRDLDLLNKWGIVESFYCHSGGGKLTDEELATYKFNDWLNFMIEFILPNYPELDKRTKKNQAAQKRKYTRKKK